MHLLSFFVPIFGFGFVLYFLPAIIAFARSKRDAGAILVLNFLLGCNRLGDRSGLGVEARRASGSSVNFIGSSGIWR